MEHWRGRSSQRGTGLQRLWPAQCRRLVERKHADVEQRSQSHHRLQDLEQGQHLWRSGTDELRFHRGGHGVIGKFLHLGIDGAFSLHDRWDGTFLKGTTFAGALPFLANQSMLVPALRGSTRVIGIYSGAGGIIKKATDIVPKATKVLPGIKLPKIKMKKLFR